MEPKINVEKLICSLYRIVVNEPITLEHLDGALLDQGIVYYDGNLKTI